MLMDLKEISMEEELDLIISGISFASHIARRDQALYKSFKDKQDITLSEERDIKILSLLEQLGYPMDHLGTYLYKEVITEIYEELKNINSRRDMDKARELITSLNNPYSSFYLWIARDYLEIGLKSFHSLIEESISKIETKNTNEELNYGLQALKYAAFISNRYNEQLTIEKTKILGLSPNNK